MNSLTAFLLTDVRLVDIKVSSLNGFSPSDLIPWIRYRTGIPISKKRLELSWLTFSVMIYIEVE